MHVVVKSTEMAKIYSKASLKGLVATQLQEFYMVILYLV